MEKRPKFYAYFNGKKYERTVILGKSKNDAEILKKKYKEQGINSIIDKRKEGYFLWYRKSYEKKKNNFTEMNDLKKINEKIEKLRIENKNLDSIFKKDPMNKTLAKKKVDVANEIRELRKKKLMIGRKK